MSLTFKIMVPVAIGAALALGSFIARPATTPTLVADAGVVAGEKISAEAEIDTIINAALAEPTGTGEEDKDSALVTSDTEILNNFDTIYEPSDL